MFYVRFILTAAAVTVIFASTACEKKATAPDMRSKSAPETSIEGRVDTPEVKDGQDGDPVQPLAAPQADIQPSNIPGEPELLEAQARKHLGDKNPEELCKILEKLTVFNSDEIAFERGKCDFIKGGLPHTDELSIAGMDLIRIAGENGYIPALEWTMQIDPRPDSYAFAYPKLEKILRQKYADAPTPANAYALARLLLSLPVEPPEALELAKKAAEDGYSPAMSWYGQRLIADKATENQGLDYLHKALAQKEPLAAIYINSHFDFIMRETKSDAEKNAAIDEIMAAAPLVMDNPLTCKILADIASYNVKQSEKAKQLLENCPSP